MGRKLLMSLSSVYGRKQKSTEGTFMVFCCFKGESSLVELYKVIKVISLNAEHFDFAFNLQEKRAAPQKLSCYMKMICNFAI